MPFKKGYIPWNKDKKATIEHRKKISEGQKGRVGYWKNKKRPEETKRKMSESHKNSKVFQEAVHSKERALKISATLKEKPQPWKIGEKCNFWKGGISYAPYNVDWTATLKKSIRERDKYICRLCNKQQEDRAHDVHHIDYNKQNCNPNNLITLCHNCHSKTNQKRSYYTEFFRIILIQ